MERALIIFAIVIALCVPQGVFASTEGPVHVHAAVGAAHHTSDVGADPDCEEMTQIVCCDFLAGHCAAEIAPPLGTFATDAPDPVRQHFLGAASGAAGLPQGFEPPPPRS